MKLIRRGILIVGPLAILAGVLYLFVLPQPFRGKGIDEWIALLDDEDRNAAYHASRALEKGGADAVPMLRAILARGNEAPVRARNEAILALGDMGWRGRDALPDLLQHLENEHDILRRNAAMGLGKMKPASTRLVSPLLRALNDPAPNVRAAAAEALAKLAPPDERLVPALIEAMRDEAAEVRSRACYAFYWMSVDVPEAVPALIGMLSDEDPMVRKHAVMGITKAGSRAPETIPALVRAVTDPDDGVNSEACSAIEDLGLAGQVLEDELLRAMDHPMPETRRRLAEVLNQQVRPTRAPEFFLVPEWPDAGLRRGAAAFLGIRRIPGVDLVLLPLLRDPDEQVRQAAARALGESGEAPPRLESALRNALVDPFAAVRIEAAVALSVLRWGSADLLEPLMSAASRAEPHTRARAVAALSRLPVDAPTILPILRKALRDESAWVRIEAASGLVALSPEDPELVPALAALVSEDEFEIRRRSSLALAELGPLAEPALPALVESLDRRKYEWHAPEIRAIGAIGPAARSAEPQVTAALRAVQNRDRISTVALALERIGVDAATVNALVLEAFLKTRSDDGREFAAEWLLDRDPVGARSGATAALTSSERWARYHAQLCLALLEVDDAERAKRALVPLSDPDVQVRLESITRLRTEGSDLVDLWAAFSSRLGDEDEKVRVQAVLGLGELDAPSPEKDAKRSVAFRKALSDPAFAVRVSAAVLLGDPDDDSGWPVLRKALTAPGCADDAERMLACELLSDLGRHKDRAVEILTEALADPRPETRITAALGLAWLGPRARPARSALEQVLDDDGIAEYSDGGRGRVRDMAQKALSAIDD